MKKRILGLVLVGLITASTAAQSALVTTTLNNVAIGSLTYNVTFVQDDDAVTTFNDVFGVGSPALTFTSQADAFAAATAVRTAGVAVGFDYTPAPGQNRNGFLLPFAYTGSTFSWFTGWSIDPIFDGVLGPFFDASRSDAPAALSFATFELAGAVPEPGSLALLGVGLAGLGLSRRRIAN